MRYKQWMSRVSGSALVALLIVLVALAFPIQAETPREAETSAMVLAPASLQPANAHPLEVNRLNGSTGRISRDLTPPGWDPQDPLPRAMISEEMGQNVDFVSRALFGPTPWHSIAFNGNTSHAYVGFENTLAIVNVANPSAPALVGWIDLPGEVAGVDYPGSGDEVYTAARGFQVVDVSDPTTPTLRGSVDVGLSPQGVDVSGTFAYVADFSSGLRIIDISDSSQPTLVSTQPTPGIAYDVVVSGTYAYVADWNRGLQVVDVTDPNIPFLAGSWISPDDVYAVQVVGDTAYLTDVSFLRIVDVTDPTQPTLLGSGRVANGTYYDVDVIGDTAYVANSGQGLQIFDVSDPADPTGLGAVDTPGQARGIVAHGDFAYITDRWSGLQVVDVSDNNAPAVRGDLESPGEAFEVLAQGDRAYYSCGSRGLFIVDLSVLPRPRIIGKWDPIRSVRDVQVVGDLAYVANSEDGLVILDLSDTTAPTVTGSFDTPGSAVAVHVVGSTAYVADGGSGLQIVDVSDPAAPTFSGTFDTPASAGDVVVRDDLAYVADNLGGLRIIDVSDAATPIELGSWEGANVGDVFVSGEFAYTGTGFDGLQVLDITNPSAPAWIGQFVTGTQTAGVFVAGTLAYIASTADGLRFVDVTSPWAPFEVGFFDTSSVANGVGFQGGYAHVTDFDGGAYVVHYIDACFDDFEPNDEFSTAWPIDEVTVHTPKICDQNDVDFFTLAAPDGGTLHITMQPPPGRDYNLFLFDSAQQLVAASTTAGDTTEEIEWTLTGGGDFFVQVVGNAGEFDANLFYSIYYTFTPCPEPQQEVYIATVSLDANSNIVLHIQDPNQPAVVTGYNIYRASDPVGPFTLIAQNVTDMDEGQPNIQYVDVGSNQGGPFFYEATAFNGVCGAEGPGAPGPLPACPPVAPCNGESCIPSENALDSVDSNLNVCLTEQGQALNCGSRTVQVVTYDCTDAPCCFEIPACPCLLGTCPEGTYLECG